MKRPTTTDPRPGASRARAIWLGGLALLFPAAAASSGAPVGEFVQRLQAALRGSPADYDRLWVPGARDSAQRLLDLRMAALFRWPEVAVEVESAKQVSGPGGAEYVVDVVVRGRAEWDPRAYGVARAFWTMQLDEDAESNEVVRREAWRLAPTASGWGAVERVLLSPVELVSAQITAGVYPGQEALLVECSYYMRSLVDGARSLRFLLDRRSHVYDLRVDGMPARLVRGNELGSLGLEGFSPELESSLRFPEPLAKGEEVLVKFKIRSPLVHLLGDGFVTTLPFRDGPFRERAWVPILGRSHGAGMPSETGRVTELTVHWPQDTFASKAVTGRPVLSRDIRPEDILFEEESLRSTVESPRHADFLLGFPGWSVADVAWSEPAVTVAGTTIRRPNSESRSLDPDRRSRAALIGPLLTASIYSTEDLESALDELLPLDDELLDVFRDEDAGGDAEEGDDDRSAG